MNKLVQLHAEKVVNRHVYEAGAISKEIYEKTDEAIMRAIDLCENMAYSRSELSNGSEKGELTENKTAAR